MVITRPRLRRLSDQVCFAFHAACDEGAVEAAERLLRHIEQIIQHPLRLPAGFDRRQPEPLTALAARLMNLLLWRQQTPYARWVIPPAGYRDAATILIPLRLAGREVGFNRHRRQIGDPAAMRALSELAGELEMTAEELERRKDGIVSVSAPTKSG